MDHASGVDGVCNAGGFPSTFTGLSRDLIVAIYMNTFLLGVCVYFSANYAERWWSVFLFASLLDRIDFI